MDGFWSPSAESGIRIVVDNMMIEPPLAHRQRLHDVALRCGRFRLTKWCSGSIVERSEYPHRAIPGQFHFDNRELWVFDEILYVTSRAGLQKWSRIVLISLHVSEAGLIHHEEQSGAHAAFERITIRTSYTAQVPASKRHRVLCLRVRHLTQTLA